MSERMDDLLDRLDTHMEQEHVVPSKLIDDIKEELGEKPVIGDDEEKIWIEVGVDD